jgi:fatty-acid desaturase
MSLYAVLDFLSNGITRFTGWEVFFYTMVVTHITIASVTIYLHRCQAHRALDLHPIVSHFFRFWLWLTTGQVTKEWASIHRKHHAKCDTEEDPHSPVTRGIKKVFWKAPSCTAPNPRTRKPWKSTATARRTTGSSATSTPATARWAWRRCWSSTSRCSA